VKIDKRKEGGVKGSGERLGGNKIRGEKKKVKIGK